MRRRRRAREGQEKKERENRRPILIKLCAAILRSFREQHSKKMKGSARGSWGPREVQQPFQPNPNEVGDRTTTLRRLLIGAGCFRSQSTLDIFAAFLIHYKGKDLFFVEMTFSTLRFNVLSIQIGSGDFFWT